MALLRWDPMRSLRSRDDAFESLFRDLFEQGEAVLEPAAEVSEADGEIVVKMSVPGVDKDQLQVTVENDVLTVRGEHRKEEEKKGKNFYRQEIRYGAFQRAVPLPGEVDSSKTKADLKNGMLTVRLPKSQQPRGRQVQVQVG